MPVFFCLVLREESNAGANFFSRKNGEAVPKPNASDGEHSSCGRLLSRAQQEKS
jgi:hypothetical protein